MEDLASKLQSILSSPEGQEQLRSIAGMLGMDSSTAPSAAPPTDPPPPPANEPPAGGMPDLSALMAMLSGGNGTPAADPLPGIDMNTILKLQQVFRSMNVNDKNSQLLLALKPHFGERRRGRVDQAISMMRLFAMLPALRESGLFAGL